MSASTRVLRSITESLTWLAVVFVTTPCWNPGVQADDAFSPLALDQVKVRGEIGRRIDITIQNNLLVLDAEKDFLQPFIEKGRPGGYIGLGKLIDAAVRFAAYTGDEKIMALKHQLVDTAIASQEDSGYLGMYAPEHRTTTIWDIHEVAYLIFALASDYEFFGQERSLAAARKAADYVMRQWPKIPDRWGHQTGVATHVAVTGLERAMISLSRLTNDARYADFCRDQRALADWDLEIVMGRRPRIEGHIYAFLCRCLAQLELYRLTPDTALLEQTDRAINFLTQSDGMCLTGGAGQWEIWTDDQDGRGALAETCATAYQVRLLDSLLRLEGEARYGDLMERTIYSSLFAAQSPDGREIRYYSPLEGPREYHPGDTYCCPCNYRRIIAELPGMVFYRAHGGVVVNLFTPSQATLPLPEDLPVAVRQETDYPHSGLVVIHVDPQRAAEFPVRLRIPAWCDTARVTINDHPPSSVAGGEFCCLRRSWKPGDRIRLEMPMPWRLVKGRKRQSGRVAVMRGPLVFCLNPASHEAIADWDGADLGQITLDPESLRDPVPDDSVRPDGLACLVEAWKPGYACKRPGNLKLRLTEFADPGGQATYFRLQDFSHAVDDELFTKTE
jgi:DUF1680 family protein